MLLYCPYTVQQGARRRVYSNKIVHVSIFFIIFLLYISTDIVYTKVEKDIWVAHWVYVGRRDLHTL